MKLIIKLHGTSGSGKTTVARGLMRAGKVTSILGITGKPEVYELGLFGFNHAIYILGNYSNTCGGLDSLPNADDHIRLLEHYGRLGHVFYEGLLGSEYYGRIGATSEQFGDQHIFAFLDTPIELCLQRIASRRAARGNLKPLDPSNTVGRVGKIQKLAVKVEKVLRRPVLLIDHTRAVEQVLDLYRKADASRSTGDIEVLDQRA